jgi:hypothetical protein
VNSSISIETRLPKGLFVSAGYELVRGLHLYRSRNINAPLPGTTEPLDPAYRNILLLESSASSRYHELSFRMNQRIGRYSLNFNYTLASNHNDTNGATSTPADTYDLTSEWALSNDNRRHSLFGGANLQLPWGLSTNVRLRANTGRPYTITTGRDDNRDSFTNDRPAGVSRNSEVGPSFFTLDLNLRKTIRFRRPAPGRANRGGPGNLSEFQGGPGNGRGGGGGNRRAGPEMTISIESSNVLNHTNFSRYSGVQSSENFGKATSAGSPREIELGVQFSF